MKANESLVDRVIRIIIGLVLLYLGWAGVVTGGWGTFFKIIGFVPLLTGIVGWCPIYAMLRISTKPKSA